MAQVRYRGSAGNQAMPLDVGRDIVAVYDDSKRTIYLPEGWTGVSPAEQSLLVHEIVHHLQNLGNLKYECAGSWSAERGKKLFTYMRYNAELTREGLNAIGCKDIEPEAVQKLDSIDAIPELLAVGTAVGEMKVRQDHFARFLPM
jgi:hypothetical protein